MNFKYTKILLSVGTLGLTLCAVPAQAQELFATFTQAFQTPAFTYSSTSGGATLGLASAIPVSFQFQTINGLGAAVGEDIEATMTMSAVSASNAFSSTSFLVQPMKDIELRFTSASAAPDSGDLLRVSLTTGNLVARVGGQTARLTGTESSTSNNIVTFDSDYLDFSQPLVNKNFAISFTSIAPDIANGGNGYLAPFTTTATGNFGSDPLPPPKNNIPEPATLVLAMLGGLALARRRRAA